MSLEVLATWALTVFSRYSNLAVMSSSSTIFPTPVRVRVPGFFLFLSHFLNSGVVSKLEELLNNVSMLQKSKMFLSGQLEEAKQSHGEEVKERQALVARHRNLDLEYGGVKDQLDDAIQQRADSVRMLGKVSSEANMWRMKFENEAVAKIEENESAKLKLQARLNEAESTVENLNNKLVILEKTKLSAWTCPEQS